jgi:hypothetical protein
MLGGCPNEDRRANGNNPAREVMPRHSTNKEITMSADSTAAPTEPEKKTETPSVVDAVFDAMLAWVDVGLAHAKTSLTGTAQAMERTAKALDAVRERLRT